MSLYVFTSVFVLEALLKIVAFNKQYFKSGWNVFDLVVVVASLIDLGVEGLKGVSVFRSFRLLRVFRLAQSWTTMRLLLCIILNTLGSLGYLTIILIIIIYIFAVTGLQLFHTDYTPDKFKGEPVPRWNFNDFLHSFMMVFRILCGEWIEPMYDCMRACNGLCFLIFIPVTVFGKTLFFLFIGLVLGAFGSDSVEQEVEPSSFALAWERIRALLDKRKGNICPTDDNLRDDGQDEADLDVLQRNVNHASSIREGQYGDVSLSTTKGKNGKQANSKCFKQSKTGKLYYSLPDVVAITKKHQSDIGTSPSMPNIRNLGKDRSSSLRRKSSQASTQSHEKRLTGSSKSLATFSIKRQVDGTLQLENVSNKISEQCKGEKSFYSVPNVEKLASEVQQVGGKVTTSLVDIRNSKFSLLTDFPRFDSNLNTDKTDQTQSSKCVTFSKFSTEQDIKSSWASLSSGTKVLPKATSVELKHGVLPNSQVYVQCTKDKKSVPEKCEKLSNSLLDQITDYWKPPAIFKQLFNPPIFIESSTDPIPLQENCRIPNLPEIVESLKKPQRKKSKKLGSSYAIVDQALKDMKYRNLLNTYTDEDLAVLPSLSNQSVQGERTLLSSVDDVNLSNMENIYEETTITNTYGTPVDLLATQQEKFTFQQPFGKPSQLIVVECPKNDSVSNVDSGLIVDPSRFNQEKSKSTDFHIKFDRAEKTPSVFRSLPTSSLNNNYNVHVDNSPDPDQQRRISLPHCNIRDVSGTNVDTDSKILQQQQLLQQHLQRYLEPSSSGSIVEVASDEDLKSNDKSPNFPYIDVEATVRQSYENQNQPHQQPRFSTRSTYYESYEEVKYLTSRKLSCLPPVSEVESDEISTVSEISNSSTQQTTSAIDMVKPTLKIFTSAEPLPTTKTSREGLTKNMSRKKIHQSTRSMSTFLAETAPNKCPPAYYVRSTGNLQNKATFADVVLASTKMLRHQKPGLSSSCIDMGMVVSNRIYDQQREFGAPKTAISLSDMKYIGSRTSQSSPSNRSNSMADVGSVCNKLSKSEGRRYSYSMSDVKNLKNSMSGGNKGSTKSLSRIGSAIMKGNIYGRD